MKKKGFTPEQIIGKLRETEVLLSQGNTASEVEPFWSVQGLLEMCRMKSFDGHLWETFKPCLFLNPEKLRLEFSPSSKVRYTFSSVDFPLLFIPPF